MAQLMDLVELWKLRVEGDQKKIEFFVERADQHDHVKNCRPHQKKAWDMITSMPPPALTKELDDRLRFWRSKHCSSRFVEWKTEMMHKLRASRDTNTRVWMSLTEALAGDLAAGAISNRNLEVAARVATGQHMEGHMRTLVWSSSEMLRRQDRKMAFMKSI